MALGSQGEAAVSGQCDAFGADARGQSLSRWGLIDSDLEAKQKLYFPHYFNRSVPLEPEANRVWREKVFLTTDRDEQKVLRRMCAEDFLFYCAGFLNIFDAGDESGRPGPVAFIPYDFQVECFTLMWAAMHDLRQPLRGKKPRRIGFSWGAIGMFEHCWHFMPNHHLLVGSHREEEVDGTQSMAKGGIDVGEWSKLMPKFDYLHVNQPSWLLPDGYKPRQEPYRTRMKLMNPANGSIVWGTSAASAAGHGERGYAVLWDEASRTENLYDIIGGLQAFSPCKFWLSTIGNLSHPFSTILKDSPGILQLSPHWWMHPDYAKDMTIDPATEVRTSPWLERKLDEIGRDPVLANQLYYADETQQVGGYYGAATFRKMLGSDALPGTVMEPRHRGELDITETPSGPLCTRFCEQGNGRWRFWMEFDAEGRPPRNTRYVMGVDIAAGSTDDAGRGASNSIIAVADWLTGELVAEFVTHGKKPYELAAIAVAAGKWFEGDDYLPAMMVPERNGPGGEFVDVAAKKYRYPNMFMQSMARGDDLKMGWHKDGRGDEARLAFGLHDEMICDGRFKERSTDCVQEMRCYQHNPNGRGAPVHSASLMARDPSGARDNHGDRVIARICICQALKRPLDVVKKRGQAPWGSYRSIREARERASHSKGLV